MRQLTNHAYQNHYDAGYQEKMKELHEVGFNAARDSFNKKYPVCVPITPMDRYYTSCGEVDALISFLK